MQSSTLLRASNTTPNPPRPRHCTGSKSVRYLGGEGGGDTLVRMEDSDLALGWVEDYREQGMKEAGLSVAD